MSSFKQTARVSASAGTKVENWFVLHDERGRVDGIGWQAYLSWCKHRTATPGLYPLWGSCSDCTGGGYEAKTLPAGGLGNGVKASRSTKTT